MPLEVATWVGDLDASNPVGATDSRSQADDHHRLVKSVLKNTFPNANKAFRFPVANAKSGIYTILSADQNALIPADATGGAFNLTLPTLAAGDAGWAVTVIKTDATVNAVTVVGTINGAANYSINRQFMAVVFQWTGSAWLAWRGALTIQAGDIANNLITDAMLRDSAGVSVIGRVTNSSGDPADIVASANGQYLCRTGDAVFFTTPPNGTIPNAALVGPRKTVQYLTSGTGATYTTPAGVKTLQAKYIGGGGGGGAVFGTAGGNGGATTFNSVDAAGGIGGGASAGAGGLGGTGGAGAAALRLAGSDGMAGIQGVDTDNGGQGAPGIFGMGAGRGGWSTTGGSAKANTGAGGGGGGLVNNDDHGGGGGSGEYVELVIQSPAASYTYTVGGGGTAGSGSVNGGSGGSGLIIVEEYY